jgi:hypothetical protein
MEDDVEESLDADDDVVDFAVAPFALVLLACVEEGGRFLVFGTIFTSSSSSSLDSNSMTSFFLLSITRFRLEPYAYNKINEYTTLCETVLKWSCNIPNFLVKLGPSFDWLSQREKPKNCCCRCCHSLEDLVLPRDSRSSNHASILVVARSWSWIEAPFPKDPNSTVELTAKFQRFRRIERLGRSNLP